jgi:hypothetical protein
MWIAKGLRRHPVLTVAAVQITAEHAEAVRKCAGVHVKKRLLLDRIALHAANVAPRRMQRPTSVEPHLAHPDCAVGNAALMTAGVAAN